MLSWLAAIPAIASQIGNIWSGLTGQHRAEKESELNRNLQMDTLKNQIQWRVADAKKAGIHPMAALGFTGMSYSPVSTAFQGTDFSGLGQDISRAVMAGSTERQRQVDAKRAILEQSQNDQYHTLQLQNMGLQNQLLASQIARFNSAQLGPGVPDAAPGSVNVVPDRVTVGSVGAPERSPGVVTDYAFGATSGGSSTIVPSLDMKQRIEDTPMEWQWFLRNGIIPDRSIMDEYTRRNPPRPGYEWKYNPFTGEFFQRRRGGFVGSMERLGEFFFQPRRYQSRR